MIDQLESHQQWLNNPEEGRRLVMKKKPVVGFDFTPYDLSNAIIAHCDLTACRFGKCHGANFVGTIGNHVDFRGADISDTTFELANIPGIKLIGAIWRGIAIDRVSVFYAGKKFVLATNVFTQIGSEQKTVEEWEKTERSDEWWGKYGIVVLKGQTSQEKSEWTVCWSSETGIQWLPLGSVELEPLFDATSVGMATVVAGKRLA